MTENLITETKSLQHSTTPYIKPRQSHLVSKSVKSSLLRSMESICLSPHIDSLSSLQQSFLGHIYRVQHRDKDYRVHGRDKDQTKNIDQIGDKE